MKAKPTPLAVALLVAAVAAAAAFASPATPPIPATPETQGASGYHVLERLALGGEGGWDYLTADAAARRLYVTRGSHVTVVDLDTGKVAGEIPNLSGIHGVALAPDLGRGYVSNGKSSEVTVFDLKTLKVLKTVKSTGENPDAILYDPASHRVFAFNGRSANATVFDAKTDAVAGTIALGGKPEFAASDLKGRVYVNIEDKSEVVALDAAKLTVAARWPLAPCEEPSGMAIDRQHGRLLVGCSNQKAGIVDLATGKVVGTPPIGKGVDANGFDPATGYGFSSNGEGTLTVLAADAAGHFKVLDTVPTERGARTMALDEKTHRVYLATAKFNPAPAPTAEQPHPRPTPVPGSFVLLVVGR
ncbi:MAG TPA: YncE family protein [Thermoanaerobaculia bacterium]|nr:YncE family protein [Thermoanaerobaculia bacterium]